MDINGDRVEVAEHPPQLDLYQPLLFDKDSEKAASLALDLNEPSAIGKGNDGIKHLATIGAKVSPIESLDYE